MASGRDALVWRAFYMFCLETLTRIQNVDYSANKDIPRKIVYFCPLTDKKIILVPKILMHCNNSNFALPGWLYENCTSVWQDSTSLPIQWRSSKLQLLSTRWMLHIAKMWEKFLRLIEDLDLHHDFVMDNL